MDSPVVIFHEPGLYYPGSASAKDRIRNGIEFILEKLAGAGEPRITDLVGSGDTVVIKPNFVTTMNYHFHLDPRQQEAVTTNLSLVSAMIEHAFRAVGRRGRIIVADSPIEAVDFSAAMGKLGVAELVKESTAKGYPVELLDIRDRRVKPMRLIENVKIGKRSLNIGYFKRSFLAGDGRGYVNIDLGSESHFEQHPWPKRLRFYHPHFRRPLKAHRPGRHLYCTSRSVLEAKLIINLPKLKTHKISGVTLAQKNLIGLMNNKFWLPHFSQGHPPGGDQLDHKPYWGEKVQNWLRVIPVGRGNSLFIRFPRVDEQTRSAQMPIYNGSWQGNDTLWRTVLDVARAIEFADVNGRICKERQRHILSIIDGVIAGEGNGPLGASPKSCGVLLGSFNMPHLDAVAARLMGFRLDMIKYLQHLDENAVSVLSNSDPLPQFSFQPPDRWESLVI